MSIMRAKSVRLGATVASAALALGGTAMLLPGDAGATKIPTKHTTTHPAAATTPTLTGVQTEAAAAVKARIAKLNAAVTRARTTQGLGAGQAALEAYLGADVQPLGQQGRTVAADTSVAQAQKDYDNIFGDFRVYRLVIPAANVAAQADRVTDSEVPTLKASAAKLQAAVDHQNQATIGPLVQDLDHQIAVASSATQGLAATVLAYTPAQWNANYSLLVPAGSAITTANVAIHQAQSDVHQIRQDLHRGGHGGRVKTLHLRRTRSRRL